MEAIKKQIQEMKDYGYEFGVLWLQLGIKQEGGGTKSTGKHIVSILEEPKMAKGSDAVTGKEFDVFELILEEVGQKKKYHVPLLNKTEDEPHYLLSRLADIPIKEKFSMEMKSKGIKNYIEVIYPLGGEEEIPVIEDGSDQEIPTEQGV